MSNKKANARIQKWRDMLTQGLHKDKQLLKSRIYKGVPSGMRQVIWPQLVKLPKYIQQKKIDINFDKLINSFSNNVYEIGLDIPRTFPQQQDSKVLRKSMNNVLKAISITYPKVGYCQGMNFLVLRILQVLGDEETFWLLHYLLENDNNLQNNFIDPISIEMQNYVLQKLLQEYCPTLLKDLHNKGLIIQTYSIKFFMNIFSGVFNQQNFNRVFEIYLIEGWPILYTVALLLFQSNQKQLKGGNMENTHFILSKKLHEIDDIDTFLLVAQDKRIPTHKIAKLQKQYLQNMRESTKSKINANQSQIRRREKRNQQKHQFAVQLQNIKAVHFQNKAEQMNFDSLYMLKNHK